MLGTWRLVLALAVVLSHLGVVVGGLNPGVVAVVCFYMISGYVITGLLRGQYAGRQAVARFYLDRALRILPQYMLVALVTLGWWAATGARTDFLRVRPSLLQLVENFLIVPLDFNMFHDIKSFTLVPAAWSLGAEIQFYLLMPILLLLRARGAAMALAAVVWAMAAFGVLHTEWFGYRLLPGILLYFLLGSVLHDLHRDPGSPGRAAWFAGGVVASCFAAAVVLAAGDSMSRDHNAEVLVGLAAGTLSLHWLAPRPRGRLDDALGLLGYGVFLNHFLVKWAFFPGIALGEWKWRMAYLATTVALAWAGHQVAEKPVSAWRTRLRQGAAQPAEGNAGPGR